jgi:hypothetical protein
MNATLRTALRAVPLILVFALGARQGDAATLPPAPVLGNPPAYVIITSQAMADSFGRLARWKTHTGLPALVKTIEAIRTEYPAAADDAERVRFFIRDAHAQWGTRWVLIGGDADAIPARLAYTQFYGGVFIPTDLYYACLDGSWNADGDSKWGEGYMSTADPGDDADLVPEVYVGRAPVRTPAEAARFVDKTLRCQFLPFEPRPHAALLMAEVLFPQNWHPGDAISFDGAEIVEPVLPYLRGNPDVHDTRLYENYTDPSWVPGALPLNRQAALDSLDAGYDLAVFIDFGTNRVLGVGGDDTLGVADALGLTNGNRLTHVYAMGSQAPDLDGSSIGEALMLAPNGGAVTAVVSTQVSFPTAYRVYFQEWMRLIYQAHLSAAGEALARSRLPFVPFSSYDGVNRMTQMEMALLGDPELHVYSGSPAPLEVARPEALALGASAFEVEVLSNGGPVAGARVAAYRQDDQLRLAETDEFGRAHLPFVADRGGSIELTVVAPDGGSFEAAIPVVEPVAVEGALGSRAPSLAAPSPNPARAAVTLRYDAGAAAGARLDLAVYDVAGKRIRTLAGGRATPGRFEQRWDLRADGGGAVPDGVYFVSLRLGESRLVRRLLVIH